MAMSQEIVYCGQKYPSIDACLKTNNIPDSTARLHAKKNGVSLAELLESDYQFSKSNSTPIAYNGITYKSMSECCRSLGISYPRFFALQKSKKNLSINEIIDYCAKNPIETFTYNGIEYKSCRKCCAALSLSYDAVRKYAEYHNCTREEAIDYYLAKNAQNDKPKRQFEFNGKTYKTIRECCDDLGVSYTEYFDYQKKNHTSFKNAISYLLAKVPKGKVLYNGKEYSTIKELCTELGVSYKAIVVYKNMRQCSLKKAIEQNIENASKSQIIVDGKKYKSRQAFCVENGYDKSLARLAKEFLAKNEFSREEVIEILEKKRTQLNNRYFTWNGIEYSSLRQACLENHFSYVNVYNYSHKHQLTPIEALDWAKENNVVDANTTLSHITPEYICRNGSQYYHATCKECKRRLLISEEEATNFVHEEEFCIERSKYI